MAEKMVNIIKVEDFGTVKINPKNGHIMISKGDDIWVHVRNGTTRELIANLINQVAVFELKLEQKSFFSRLWKR